MAQISHLWWFISFHVWKRVCQWQAQQILRFCTSQGCKQGLKCSSPTPQLGPLARPGGTCYSWQGPKPFEKSIYTTARAFLESSQNAHLRGQEERP